jgi:hypothetical protein
VFFVTMGTLMNAIGVLSVLSTMAEAIPVVGSNLKVAAELASKICQTVQVRTLLGLRFAVPNFFSAQNIKDNRKSYEDLALHVEQLLVAIASALQRTREERLGAMTANVERLIKCVLIHNIHVFGLRLWPTRVLEEIQIAVHDRTRSDTPSPVGGCEQLSTWLCNTTTDVTRSATDQDNIKDMRRQLQEVVVEFDVRRSESLILESMVILTWTLLSGGCANAD